MKGGFFMQTELQVSVVYLSQETNDIDEFDFFIRMIPTEDRNIVSVSAVPRFSLDGKLVKNIRLSVLATESLSAFDVLKMISQLKELKGIVSDVKAKFICLTFFLSREYLGTAVTVIQPTSSLGIILMKKSNSLMSFVSSPA